jgi:hypothetical protein
MTTVSVRNAFEEIETNGIEPPLALFQLSRSTQKYVGTYHDGASKR